MEIEWWRKDEVMDVLEETGMMNGMEVTGMIE
jgi:hypothetical protein